MSSVLESQLGFNHLMEVFTEYAYNESFFENGSQDFNVTEEGGRHQYNYYAMLLTLLIFVIVFGNVLVCMAVSREKALQTTTNYLIVSLAVADLLVATLVMPWVVYLEVGFSVIGSFLVGNAKMILTMNHMQFVIMQVQIIQLFSTD